MRRVCLLLCLLVLGPAASASALTEAPLRSSLSRTMNAAGSSSGAHVVDLTDGRVLFSRRAEAPRIPASNEKLFTTATAIAKYGPRGRFSTRILGDGRREGDTWVGSLYLRGGGDPMFGSARFTRSAYGEGATVEDLAAKLAALGISRVTGSVFGDESFFDRRRGSPADGFAVSIYLGGQLSGLAFNRGLTPGGGGLQSRPALYAARELATALRGRGVRVLGATAERTAPASARTLALVRSPTAAFISRFTNRPSDNYLAEMLLKGLGASFAADGTTAQGARVTETFLAGLGVSARIVDGSGLARSNRISPKETTDLLAAMSADATAGPAFVESLAIAGRRGTVSGRMRGTAAAGRCKGKTGTLSNVSAWSGYCDTGGRRIAFSFLMNGVSVGGARSLQDRMTAAIATYRAG